MVKITSILSILTALLTTILYFFSVPVHKTIPTTVTYTALGDSIAEGVGATDHRGYTTLLSDHLKTLFQTVNFKNAAKSGDTSADLLSKLQTSSELKQYITASDMITICIGGNNILQGIDQTVAGNFNGLDVGIDTFAENWPQILQVIRETNNKCKIYVMTVYNPISIGDSYNNQFLITPPYYEMIDSYIRKLNAIISEPNTCNQYHYKVVDVYTGFKEYTDQSKPLHGFHDQADPHPTDAGHKLISDLHIKALEF